MTEDEKEYEYNLALMILNAINGDREEQCSLGTAYANGEYGLTKDEERAIYWWKKAAEQNEMCSAYDLYLFYTEQKKHSVADFYKKQIEQQSLNGDENAKTYLSFINEDSTSKEINIENSSSESIEIEPNVKTYEDVRNSFRNYLTTDWITSAGEPLPVTSASSYTSFVAKLIAVYKESTQDDSIDYLPQFVISDQDRFNLLVAECKKFIQDKKKISSSDDKKNWNNRNSAFNAYVIFLSNFFENDIETEDDLEVVNKVDVNKTSSVYEDELSYKELRNKFLSRLKTQGRYYPRSDIYFPIRLLNKIFSDKKDSRLKDWMLNDLNRMDILESDGSAITFSSISKMQITKDGKLLVFIKDGTDFEAYTRTSSNTIIPITIKKQWASITIDHKVSMSATVDALYSQFTGLSEVSALIKSYVTEKGIEPRVMIGSRKANLEYVNDFYEKNKGELYKLRDNIMDDLNLMEFSYELMDFSENSSKGK